MRSVKCFEDRVYTGFYMDFGYWKKNEFGSLKYTSIAREGNVQMIEDEQIWEIFELLRTLSQFQYTDFADITFSG